MSACNTVQALIKKGDQRFFKEVGGIKRKGTVGKGGINTLCELRCSFYNNRFTQSKM